MRFMQVARLAGAVLLALPALPASAQQFTTPRQSPAAKVTQTVGTTEFSVAYSRPGAPER